jgi:hypothetical protein
LNPGRRGRKLATNRLSYGAASLYPYSPHYNEVSFMPLPLYLQKKEFLAAIKKILSPYLEYIPDNQ